MDSMGKRKPLPSGQGQSSNMRLYECALVCDRHLITRKYGINILNYPKASMYEVTTLILHAVFILTARGFEYNNITCVQNL